ncbi:hypothetical protein [Sodalis-like endosymbiont of Proechinophthirus fluctus]|uniref:hypothetical protein n=1 Tax=Sodalis-like endosymbiont of Proechinophthirus fluctus TaxID=1462730 RepID=UPI000AD0409D|nr:hypothetical protein [Sodalis-like endosymbiont of Proechinophthirus fluctus]
MYDDEHTWLLLKERSMERQALLDALRRAKGIPMSPVLNAAIRRLWYKAVARC